MESEILTVDNHERYEDRLALRADALRTLMEAVDQQDDDAVSIAVDQAKSTFSPELEAYNTFREQLTQGGFAPGKTGYAAGSQALKETLQASFSGLRTTANTVHTFARLVVLGDENSPLALITEEMKAITRPDGSGYWAFPAKYPVV